MAKILVIDDAADTRKLVKNVLSKVGHEVFQASNGAEALKKLDSDKFDLILLDIMMPNMNGWEFLRKFRIDSEKYGSGAVIFLSVKTKSEYDNHSEESSLYSAYITKPFGNAELISKVKSTLDTYHAFFSKQDKLKLLLMSIESFVDVEQAVLLTVDGLVMASGLKVKDSQTVAAEIASMFGAADSASLDLGKSHTREVIVKGDNSYLVTHNVGGNMILGVVAKISVDIDKLLNEMDVVGAKINEVM